MVDLLADWLVAKATLAGLDPFQPLAEIAEQLGLQIGFGFQDPSTPSAIVLLLPLAIIPIDSLQDVGAALIVIEALSAGWVFARLAGIQTLRVLPFVPAFLLTIGPMNVISLGTLEMLLLVLLGLAALGIRRNEPLTGALIGIAAGFKLWPLLAVLVLILSNRRKLGLAALGTFLGLNVIGLALPNVTFVASAEALLGGVQFLGHPRNGSFPSVLVMAGIPASLALLVSAVGIGVFILWTTRQEPEDAFLASIPVALFLGPIAWPAYLTLLALPMTRVSRPIQVAACLAIAWMAHYPNSLADRHIDLDGSASRDRFRLDEDPLKLPGT